MVNSASCSPSPSFSTANSSTVYALTVLHAAAGKNMFNDTFPELDQKLERHSCKFAGVGKGRKKLTLNVPPHSRKGVLFVYDRHIVTKLFFIYFEGNHLMVSDV